MKVSFLKCSQSLEEEVGGVRYISDVVASYPEEENYDEYFIFDINKTNRKIVSLKATKEVLVIVRKKERDIGTSDVPDLKTFQSSEHHTDVSAYDLSERWGISLSQATITLKKTMQKFLCSTVIPLARIYRTDRVLT